MMRGLRNPSPPFHAMFACILMIACGCAKHPEPATEVDANDHPKNLAADAEKPSDTHGVALPANPVALAPLAFSPLMIEPTSIEKEVYEEVAAIEYEFVVRNTTDRTVKIAEVQPSCSCAAGELSKSTLAPNEAATFRVRYDVASQFGKLATRTITLQTDDKPAKPATCQVGGFRRQRFEITPATIEFGTVAVGDSPVQDLVIEARGDDAHLAFERFSTSSPYVQLELVRREPRENGARFQARVRLLKTAPVGTLGAQLFVPNDRDSKIGPTVKAHAQIAGPVRVVPPVAFFGYVKPGPPLKRNVQLKPQNDSQTTSPPTKIDRVAFERVPDGFSVAADSGDAPFIEIGVDPTRLKGGEFDHSIVISCRIDDKPCRVELILRGVKARPE